MPDITTPEGREGLRQLAGAHGSPDDMVWLLPALDGLDIAQELARVLACWHPLAVCARDEPPQCPSCKARAKWDKWQKA